MLPNIILVMYIKEECTSHLGRLAPLLLLLEREALRARERAGPVRRAVRRTAPLAPPPLPLRAHPLALLVL